MTWTHLILELDSGQTETLSEALLEAGALSVDVEDALAGTADEKPQFGEPGLIRSPADPGWQRSRMTVLFDPKCHPLDKIADLVTICCKIAGLDEPPPWRTISVAEEDWVASTQAQFAPICISDRLWIVPSWHNPPKPEAINIVIDPGMAFGTGSHPTTQLCLQWLEKVINKGESFLDYGCGSGILAIAAARLGAAPVVGVDIDEHAVSTARINAANNQVMADFIVSTRKLDGAFDHVVANILANPLRLLAPAICARVRAGGNLALSGILMDQIEEIVSIYAPYLPLDVFATNEGWACLTGKMPMDLF